MNDKEKRQILVREKSNGNVRNEGVLTTDTGVTYNCNFYDCVKICVSSPHSTEKYSGDCVINFINNGVFEGTILDGNLVQGRISFSTITVFEGTFLNNKICTGKGIHINNCNGVYEGEFLNGTFTGFGVYYYPDDTIYEGNFVNYKFEGKGKMTYPNRNTYEGDFVNGKFEGKGKFRWSSNGAVYEGDFIDGKRMYEFNAHDETRAKMTCKLYYDDI